MNLFGMFLRDSQTIVNRLVDHYGWERLGRMIAINCFNRDPSRSDLKAG